MPVDPDKALGALLGLAIGESLGGDPMASTQMAFRLADSLIAQGGFDPDDVLRSDVSWDGTGTRRRRPRGGRRPAADLRRRRRLPRDVDARDDRRRDARADALDADRD